MSQRSYLFVSAVIFSLVFLLHVLRLFYGWSALIGGWMVPVRAVDVAGPERGGEAVAVLTEDEERVIADGLKVAVVGGLLLRPVDRALGAIDVEGHASGLGRCALHQLRIEAREPLIVPLLREDVRLEPVERGGEGDARLPPLARGQHPKRRVLGQPSRVVGVFVPGQAVDRLAKEIRQGELRVVSGARISQVPLDQGVKCT
jgi:hypothetical protein